MNSRIKDERLDELFGAIMKLQTLEEFYMFFEDLCSVAELKSMEQRFQVAKMLSEGRVYADIAKETGSSTATISRVNRSLSYGADGYKLALERIRG